MLTFLGKVKLKSLLTSVSISQAAVQPSNVKDSHFSEIGDFQWLVLGSNVRASVLNVTKHVCI